jgi:hypothetical protein
VRIRVVAFVVASSVIPCAAQAQDRAPTVRLDVDPTADEASCPTRDGLASDVRRRMGRDPFADDAPRWLSVRFRRHSSGWRARITARDRDSAERAVRDLPRRTETCAELLDAVGLALALAIDPDAPLVSVAPTTAQCPPAPECPAAAQCPATPECPVVAPRIVVREVPTAPRGVPSSLSLRAGVTAGATPFAPSMSVQFRSRHEGLWHATAGVTYIPVTRPDAATGFGLTALFAGACAGTLGSFRVAGCAGLVAGALHAVVFELVPVAPGDRFYAGLFVEGSARVRVAGPVFAEGAVRVTAALAQQRYSVRGRASLGLDPWPVAIDATLGAGVDF